MLKILLPPSSNSSRTWHREGGKEGRGKRDALSMLSETDDADAVCEAEDTEDAEDADGE